MHIGVVFPHTEIGVDPAVIRDYAQAVEGMGCTHLVAYDELLLSDPEQVKDMQLYYSLKDTMHEPLVLLGFLAGVTQGLGLATAVLIVTARQTGLVAKQAAEVDVLSGGRLRLGLGLGWNTYAYRALGQEFNNRGKRVEEQIAVLRALWTQKSVNFSGNWHQFSHLGLNPVPVQRPIPIWLGGSADPVLDRIGRLADGWFADALEPATEERLARLRQSARASGRDPKSIGLEGRVAVGDLTPDQWAAAAQTWHRLGATHIQVDTMNAGMRSVDEHIKAIRHFMEVTKSLRS